MLSLVSMARPFLADPFGDHDLVCRKADKLTRHNYVGAALVRLARLVGLSARQANVIEALGLTVMAPWKPRFNRAEICLARQHPNGPNYPVRARPTVARGPPRCREG